MVIYRAMQSQSGKEEFLNQFRSIVDGVRQNRLKIDKQVADEKKKRDNLAGSLQVPSRRNQRPVQLLIYATILFRTCWNCNGHTRAQYVN